MSVVMLTALTPCMRGPYIVEQSHDVDTGSHNKITGMKQDRLVWALRQERDAEDFNLLGSAEAGYGIRIFGHSGASHISDTMKRTDIREDSVRQDVGRDEK